MSELTRAGLCLASMLFAWCVMGALGFGVFGYSHIWRSGLTIFLFAYALLMLLIVRTRAANSVLVIPVCAALVWPADAVVALMGPQSATTFISNQSPLPPLAFAILTLLIRPLVSKAWLFGAATGCFFALARHALTPNGRR